MKKLFMFLLLLVVIQFLPTLMVSAADLVIIDHDTIRNGSPYDILTDVEEFTLGPLTPTKHAWRHSTLNTTTSFGMPGGNELTINTSQTGDWCAWTPKGGKLDAGAKYKVSFWNVRRAGAWDKTVQFEIAHKDGITPKTIDQEDASGATSDWVELGTYTFSGNGEEYVKLTRINTTGSSAYTHADAVKFEKIPDDKSENKLSLLSVDSGTLTPAFDPAETTYTLSGVSYPELNVTAACKNPNASLTINGNAGGTYKMGMKLGENIISIVVTPEEGGEPKTYTITATLTELIVSPRHTLNYSSSGTWGTSGAAADFDGKSTMWSQDTGAWAQWSPKIDTAGYYNIQVYRPINTGASGGAGTDSDSQTVFEIKHNEVTDKMHRNMRASSGGWINLGAYYFDGSGNECIRLTRGNSVLRAGSVKFTPVVEDVSDAALSSINIDGARPNDFIVPFFENTVLGYSLFTYNIDCVEVLALPSNNDAVVTVNGGEPVPYGQKAKVRLNAGPNEIKITCTPKNGGTPTEYTVTVNQYYSRIGFYKGTVSQENKVTSLSGLSVGDTLTANFEYVSSSAEVKPVTLFVALYKKTPDEDELINLSDPVSGSADNNTPAKLSQTIVLPNLEDADYVLKAFYWDMENGMSPYHAATILPE